MKRICIGVMAHVDAGKTTLLEAMLYRGGATRRLGRVDHQDAFLDTDEQERARHYDLLQAGGAGAAGGGYHVS